MDGFIVMDHQERYSEIVAELSTWLMSGRIQHREHVVQGLENAPSALGMLFDGSNQGKLMIEVV